MIGDVKGILTEATPVKISMWPYGKWYRNQLPPLGRGPYSDQADGVAPIRAAGQSLLEAGGGIAPFRLTCVGVFAVHV